MSTDNAEAVLNRFLNECLQCGACQVACSLLGDLGLGIEEIAQGVLRDQVSDEALAAIQRCDLCGRCAQVCEAGLNVAGLMTASRELLIQKGRIDPADYDVMRVDGEWSFFTIYRDTYDIRYDDLAASRCEALFFPGCTLAAYGPELTRAAFGWLQGQGLQVGLCDLCCGKPLESIGLQAEADRYMERLRERLAETGAKEIVTTCTNCEARLRSAQLPGLQVRSLYALLAEAGVRLAGTETLTFHDPCPSRHDPTNPRHVRGLFAGYPQVEMASHGKDALCCGSGGIVSSIDPELCTTRAQRRIAEFADSGAATCVTNCMGCAHRLARISGPAQVRHCLEYVFDVTIDYAQVDLNAHAMWAGPQGELNAQRLADAQARLVARSGGEAHD